MPRFKVLLTCTFILGCGDDNSVAVDANVFADAPKSCPPQTAIPLPPGMHTLYVNTEGVTLTPGPDDARTNVSTLVMTLQDVPALIPNETERQSSIEVIVRYVQGALAPYSIDVVTTRPASGDYWMAVLGGSSTTIIGTPNVASIAPGVCDALNRNRVSIGFDRGLITPQSYANVVLSDFAAMIGMAVTAKFGDCMCRYGTVCENPDDSLICKFGVDVPVGTTNSCGRTTQDEPAHLASVLGCR